MAVIGYARVSTDGQTLDAQQAALKAAGAERIYAEKVSGVVTDRKALGKAIAALQAGDVLLVTRLDRLARSTRDLLNVLATIGDKSAGFRSLADTWADTTTAHGRLMVTILGGLAEFERELIKARTDDGRKRAMARGVRFGRKVKLTPHQIAEALRRRDAGEALTEIARSYNVSHSTISRLLAEAGPTVGTGTVRGVRAELAAIEPLEKAAAKERQGTRTDKLGGKLPPGSKRRPPNPARPFGPPAAVQLPRQS